MSEEKYISKIFIPDNFTVDVDDSNTVHLLDNEDKFKEEDSKNLEGINICLNK